MAGSADADTKRMSRGLL